MNPGGESLASAAAFAITVALFVPYIRGILAGSLRPHVFSWVIWALGTEIVFFAQLAGGGGVGAWPIGFSGILTLAVAILAWQRRGDVSFTRMDFTFLIAALGTLPLWFLTRDPLTAVVVLTIVDLLGFGPTTRRAWHHPHEESLLFFALGALRNGLVVVALERLSLTTVLFPAAVGAACLLLAIMIAVRRRWLASTPAQIRAPSKVQP